MSGVQSISFASNYLIPFNQIKDSATMRNIGAESAKYIKSENDMMQTPEGIVVKVDDAKDKEYEAIVAKYGVAIKKYDGEIKPNSAKEMELRSYSFMTSRLHPEDAQKRIEDFKNLDDEAKKAEYAKIYNEFKASDKSIEKVMTDVKPKLTPTDKPIIQYESKDGEKFMAREVMLENGYKCMAVSNAKNPSQTTLMNHDEFKKYLLETAKQVQKS